MSKRDTALTCAKIAGYHEDKKTFTRLVIECRVNMQAMQQAFNIGRQAKANGMKCSCYDCKKQEAA
jgi:hypothetical protein